MQGRDYLDPEDVRAIAPDVLRHRLGLTFEAQGEGVSADRVVAEILSLVALP
jgi:MoxR-like ATPase